MRYTMKKPETQALEERLPALLGKISDRLLIAFIYRSNIRLELSTTSDHELKFSFLRNGQLSVHFCELLGSRLDSGEDLLMREHRKLHAGDYGLKRSGNDRSDSTADD